MAVWIRYPDESIFNEQSLRNSILFHWGPAGAHIDVFDSMLAEIARLRVAVGDCEEDKEGERREMAYLDIMQDVLMDYGDKCCDNQNHCACSMARMSRVPGVRQEGRR